MTEDDLKSAQDLFQQRRRLLVRAPEGHRRLAPSVRITPPKDEVAVAVTVRGKAK